MSGTMKPIKRQRADQRRNTKSTSLSPGSPRSTRSPGSTQSPRPAKRLHASPRATPAPRPVPGHGELKLSHPAPPQTSSSSSPSLSSPSSSSSSPLSYTHLVTLLAISPILPSSTPTFVETSYDVKTAQKHLWESILVWFGEQRSADGRGSLSSLSSLSPTPFSRSLDEFIFSMETEAKGSGHHILVGQDCVHLILWMSHKTEIPTSHSLVNFTVRASVRRGASPVTLLSLLNAKDDNVTRTIWRIHSLIPTANLDIATIYAVIPSIPSINEDYRTIAVVAQQPHRLI